MEMWIYIMIYLFKLFVTSNKYRNILSYKQIQVIWN